MGFLEVLFYCVAIVGGGYLVYDLLALIANDHMGGPDGPDRWA